MSWDVMLCYRDGEPLCSVKRIQEGGTQLVGGTNECELNITYNYSELYHRVFPLTENENHNMTTSGLAWLSGKTGKESIPVLEGAVEVLGVKRNDDYWNATEGNAGFALSILLEWAKEHPTGIFRVY